MILKHLSVVFLAISGLLITLVSAFFSIKGFVLFLPDPELFYGLLGLGIAFELAKVTGSTFLFHRMSDKSFPNFFKVILTGAVLSLVAFSALFTYVHLNASASESLAGSSTNTVQIQQLQTRNIEIQDRLKGIDKEINSISAESPSAKIRLYNALQPEKQELQLEYNSNFKELQAMQKTNVTSDQYVFLTSLSDATGMSKEKIFSLVTLFIVLVIDPLAISLFLCATYILSTYKKKEDEDTYGAQSNEAFTDLGNSIQKILNEENSEMKVQPQGRVDNTDLNTLLQKTIDAVKDEDQCLDIKDFPPSKTEEEKTIALHRALVFAQKYKGTPMYMQKVTEAAVDYLDNDSVIDTKLYPAITGLRTLVYDNAQRYFNKENALTDAIYNMVRAAKGIKLKETKNFINQSLFPLEANYYISVSTEGDHGELSALVAEKFKLHDSAKAPDTQLSDNEIIALSNEALNAGSMVEAISIWRQLPPGLSHTNDVLEQIYEKFTKNSEDLQNISQEVEILPNLDAKETTSSIIEDQNNSFNSKDSEILPPKGEKTKSEENKDQNSLSSNNDAGSEADYLANRLKPSNENFKPLGDELENSSKVSDSDFCAPTVKTSHSTPNYDITSKIISKDISYANSPEAPSLLGQDADALRSSTEVISAISVEQVVLGDNDANVYNTVKVADNLNSLEDSEKAHTYICNELPAKETVDNFQRFTESAIPLQPISESSSNITVDLSGTNTSDYTVETTPTTPNLSNNPLTVSLTNTLTDSVSNSSSNNSSDLDLDKSNLYTDLISTDSNCIVDTNLSTPVPTLRVLTPSDENVNNTVVTGKLNTGDSPYRFNDWNGQEQVLIVDAKDVQPKMLDGIVELSTVATEGSYTIDERKVSDALAFPVEAVKDDNGITVEDKGDYVITTNTQPMLILNGDLDSNTYDTRPAVDLEVASTQYNQDTDKVEVVLRPAHVSTSFNPSDNDSTVEAELDEVLEKTATLGHKRKVLHKRPN